MGSNIPETLITPKLVPTLKPVAPIAPIALTKPNISNHNTEYLTESIKLLLINKYIYIYIQWIIIFLIIIKINIAAKKY